MPKEKTISEKIEEIRIAMSAIESGHLDHSPELREVVKKLIYLHENSWIDFSEVNCKNLRLSKKGFRSYEINLPPFYFERVDLETSIWPKLLVEGGIDSQKKLFDFIMSKLE